MRVQGFHHLALQVNDLERAAAFYRTVLGLEERARHHREDGSLRSIWLNVPGGGFLALEACAGALPADGFRRDDPGFHLLALGIDPASRGDVERELERLGVPVVHRTRWTVYLRDPEGNRIGLSHYPDDPVNDPLSRAS
jgi:glyoxylase I family protein